MEPPTPIPQSPISGARHRLAFLRSRTMILCLCVTAFGIPSALLGASTSSQIPLFEESPNPTPPSTAQARPEPQVLKRWVRHERAMRLNRTALDVMSRPRTGAPTEVTLNLFDANPRTLDLDQPREHPKQTKVWRGRLRGEAGSDVTLVTHGTAMVGTILSNQRLYKIETADRNLHRLIEIDEAALPPDHHPIIVADDDPVTAPPTEGPPQQTDPTASTAADTTVDLLVVYTSAARTQEGGQAAMEALIALAVDSANQAYSNSQIAMQLRLVHTAEVVYSESGAINTDLTRLRSTTDGIMDQVHQLRDQYKADLVALIVDNGGSSCGIAYVMTNGPRASFASSAFSVMARDCIVNDTLAHELGHNMGNAHDRATGGTGVFAYSYGYRDVVGRFRTIMAYACPTVSCPRVKYFSNPNIMINGRPAGIDHAIDPTNSADNARSMNEVRQIVAAWRAGAQDVIPPAAPRNFRVIVP
ncbi:MAG: zinc-dependent metalloprotease [Nitrospirae bacterium]|nr:zinc-dependent metalloprotease [Nitrospirota bacterium]